MALVYTPGLIYPPLVHAGFSNGFAAGNLLIDATGEKVAFNGRVYWGNYDGSETKNITKVGFNFGAVTKASGSGLTLSLQDVSLTAGPCIQPDGTIDQSVAISNSDAGFVSNSWYLSNALDTTRTVAYGDLLSVVWEYDGSGRLGADSVVIRAFNSGINSSTEHSGLFTGGTWAVASQSMMIVLFEFDDGTFGTFRTAYAGKHFSVFLYNSSSTPDEYGEKIVIPYNCVVDGVQVYAYTATAGGDFKVSLENDSGTVLAGPITLDYNAMTGPNNSGYQRVMFPTPVSLTAGDTVYICVTPANTNNIVTSYAEVADANHWNAWPFGNNHNAASRTNAGAWTDNTLRRMDYHLSILQIDDGSGGGGGGSGPYRASPKL